MPIRATSYCGVFILLPMLTGSGRAHHGEILLAVTALADAHTAAEHGSARSKIVVDITPA